MVYREGTRTFNANAMQVIQGQLGGGGSFRSIKGAQDSIGVCFSELKSYNLYSILLV